MARAIMHICGSVMVQKRWQFSLWGTNAPKEDTNVLINNISLPLLCFVCIYCTEAGHSICRNPSLCLWLEEEKVNTAKIKMDLRLGGASNNVQYSKTKLGCQVSCFSLFTCVCTAALVRGAFNQLCIYQFMALRSLICQ